jgi:polyisoprenoid-binding protein YceI
LQIRCAILALTTSLSVDAATYFIDPNDTTANFEVQFLGVFPLRGNFQRTTGTLSYDRATKQGSIEVLIDTSTLVSNNVRAQSLARGAGFFEVDKYPSIEFRSSRFVFGDSRLQSIEGSLTLVGKTQPVVLTVNDSGCDRETENAPVICHAMAELIVRRSAFGIKAWAHTVSEEVAIQIAITARQDIGGAPGKNQGTDSEITALSAFQERR